MGEVEGLQEVVGDNRGDARIELVLVTPGALEQCAEVDALDQFHGEKARAGDVLDRYADLQFVLIDCEKEDYVRFFDRLRLAPGAVVVVGRGDTVVMRRAYGQKAIEPRPEPMTLDTIFDLASLTKVVATTPAVMMLVEDGRIRLTDPVASFIPEFVFIGKRTVYPRSSAAYERRHIGTCTS